MTAGMVTPPVVTVAVPEVWTNCTVPVPGVRVKPVDAVIHAFAPLEVMLIVPDPNVSARVAVPFPTKPEVESILPFKFSVPVYSWELLPGPQFQSSCKV